MKLLNNKLNVSVLIIVVLLVFFSPNTINAQDSEESNSDQCLATQSLASPQDEERAFCNWYRDFGGMCCSQEASQQLLDRKEVDEEKDDCEALPSSCIDYKYMFACAAACSARMTPYLDEIRFIKVCQGWIDKFVDACSGLKFTDADGECVDMDRNAVESQVIGLINNEADFVRTDNDQVCWNGAPALSTRFSIIVAVLMTVLFVVF
eukprot:gb/GECH01012062.1/.p1 GENE.gb/GECH01012062.1/~~gb/GECH01012062.1/.p1  ORF type:complete len:207 (+),score=44.26 gb/GECH01012062.1/:1-621(+)